MWKGEDVEDSKGRTFKGADRALVGVREGGFDQLAATVPLCSAHASLGDDPTWQRNCPFGASKGAAGHPATQHSRSTSTPPESLQVVNLIKARTLH